jgi:hypothetical protein
MTRITVNKPPSPGSAAQTHRSSDTPGSFLLRLTATEGRGLIWHTPTAQRLFSGGARYRSHRDE